MDEDPYKSPAPIREQLPQFSELRMLGVALICVAAWLIGEFFWHMGVYEIYGEMLLYFAGFLLAGLGVGIIAKRPIAGAFVGLALSLLVDIVAGIF